jgi:MFS family permease
VASVWTTSLGDGLALGAGPLLVASQTRQPFLVALAAMLQRLPWLVFGLYAGALADRLDRRRMVMVCDALRVVVLGVLGLVIVTGEVDIHVVLLAMLLIGVAEVFSDSAARTLLPILVARADLGIGNARLMTGTIALDQLAGPTLGAFLFAAGMSLPFVTQAVLVASVSCSSPASPPRLARCATSRDHTCGRTSPTASGGCCATPPCTRWPW